MKRIFVVTLVLILLALSSCAPAPSTSSSTPPPSLSITQSPIATPISTLAPTTNIPTLSLTYENSAYGVSIKYPQGWTKQEGTAGTVVQFFSPKESSSDSQEALAIAVQDLPAQSLLLDTFTEKIISQLKQTLTDFNLIESSAATLAGNPAHKVVYTGKQEQRNPKVLRVWTIVNNKAYIITYAANPNNFSDFLEIIQQMIDSFSISIATPNLTTTSKPTPNITPAQTPTLTALPTSNTTPSSTASPEKADLVLINGKVITVDAKDSIAQAVAVKNGKIIKVGSNEEVKTFISQQTNVLDLKGRTVTPGLIDAHFHVMYWGMQFWSGFIDIRYPKARTKADLLGLVAERAKTISKGEWIAGNQGFNIVMEETPSLKELDAVSPDNPVYLRHVSGQHAIVNSYALRLAGITKSTPNPYGGRIEKDPVSGEPTGRLFHYSAENLVGKLASGYGARTDAEAIDFVKLGQDSALAAGYTSAQDVIVSATKDIEIYQQVAANNELKMRVYMLRYISSEKEGINLLSKAEPLKSEMLTFGGWKFALDGGSGSGNMLMYNHNLPNAKDSYEYYDQESLNRIVSMLHKAGYQVSFHAQGDKAIDMAINAIEAALKETPRNDSRFRIEHLIFPTQEALERIKKLGIVVVMQPQWINTVGEGYRQGADEQTMQRFIPLKTMMDMGIHVALGCDVPSTRVVEPKYAFIGAVTRTTLSGYTPAPKECISIKDALRMHTMGSAYASFEENIKGSIEEGKLADMVVWSHDLYTMPTSQLMDLKALVTIVGGKIVYEEK